MLKKRITSSGFIPEEKQKQEDISLYNANIN